MTRALSRVDSLDCEVGMSSFVHLDQSHLQEPLVWDKMTSEQRQCWNGRRITIFGQHNCGVTALSNMLSGKASTMIASPKPSEHLGPLKLRLLFDYEEADLCLELEGLGSVRLETYKPFECLLQTFPTWRFLSAHHDARPEDSETSLENGDVNSSGGVHKYTYIR